MKKIFFAVLIISLFVSMSYSITLSDLYDVNPDIKKSYEGVLKDSEKQKVLDYLNYVRKLHNLKPVVYEKNFDIITAKASLIMTANATLTHTPDKKMKCFTQEGADGAKTSNLYISGYSDQSMMEDSTISIKSWLTDDNVDNLGHRRWVLDPFLKYVSFGRVDGIPLVKSDFFMTAETLRVVNPEQNDISDTNIEYVAYPVSEYPKDLFIKEWFLSFTAIPSVKNIWDNRLVSYKKTVIEITDSAGKKLKISDISFNNDGFGVPNIIQWKTTGLKDNVKYTVSIKNVMNGSESKDYKYNFILK